MQWLYIDATREGYLVVRFTGGFDLYVYRVVAALRHRATGELLAIVPIARA